MMILRELVPDLSDSFLQNNLSYMKKNKMEKMEKSRTEKCSTRTVRFKARFNALGALCLTSKTTRMDALQLYVKSANKGTLYIDIQGEPLDHQDYLDYHASLDWFPLRLDIIPFFREVEIEILGCDPERHTAVVEQLNNISSLLEGEKVPKLRIRWDADYAAWKSLHGTLKHFIEVSRRMIPR